MSTNPMDKRELPPAIADTLRRLRNSLIDQIDATLYEALRFYGWKPVDATVTLLKEADKPLSMNELIERLKSGGIAMLAGDSSGGADGDLKRSIGYYTGRQNQVIKEVNGLVGLSEWDEERFK